MVSYLSATANHLYGWGSGWLEDEKPLYTRRMRKIKLGVAGFTTFLTIVALVADWYNLSFFALHTRPNVIEKNDDFTDNVFFSIVTLCALSTLSGFFELVAFVFQFKDTRNYVSPRRRSELTEELVSCGILIVENTLIPLVFVIGYFNGSSTVAAQIRSVPARLAFFATAVSAIWRVVQSFAYCCHAKYNTCGFIMCQWLRYMRGFFLFLSLLLSLFLIVLSLSLRAATQVDNYAKIRHDFRDQFSDTTSHVHLYQRFVAPYEIISGNGHEKSCQFYESRIRIAKPSELKSSFKDKYVVKVRCADVSEFYQSLIRNKHRSLAVTYDCFVIIGIHDSDFRAARIINAGYELHDPDSSTCVSGHLDLDVDRTYDVTESHKIDLDFLWTNRTLQGLSSTFCGENCNQNAPIYSGNSMVFNCSESTCISESTSRDDVDIGHVSSLLVPEREMMSYYPSMPNVVIDSSFSLPLCKHNVPLHESNSSLIEYTTCDRPYMTHISNDIRKDWLKEEEQELN